MSLPTYQDAMLPVLQVLGDGREHHRRSLADSMADHFKLTPNERTALLPSGKTPVIRSRTAWALAYMKQAGLISALRRGWYKITAQGLRVLANAPKRIDNDYLMQFEGFRDFKARSKMKSEAEEAANASVGRITATDHYDVPPDEALEGAYIRLRAAIETELLDTVKNVAPSFFEQIVIDLLVQMGYGGSRKEAARAVGRSGDGGIDGVIDEDRLGLDVIYIQAKRWEASVGRPEVQKFAGALQGQRAKKGIFITTSSFTKDAEEYAKRIDTRIVLIDGERLASLLFDYDLGVTQRSSYSVKTIDSDYFDES